MKIHTTKSILKPIILILLVFNSCSDGVYPSVDLKFSNSIDGNPIVFHDVIYVNEFGNEYNVMRLKYLLSNITLCSDNGSKFLLEDVHFVDSESPMSEFGYELVKIPQGNYTSVSFTFGLDEEMNVSNSFVAENFHNTMAWPDAMGGGYHYMRLEGIYNHTDGTEHFYNTHLGRWQDFDNHIELNFPIELYATSDNIYEILIAMNVNNWYNNPHMYNFEDYEVGIMGNLTAQDLLSANGEDVFSVSLVKN